MHPLDKIRLKLDRAKEHLSTLDHEVGEFEKLEPYRVEPHPPLPALKLGDTELPLSLPQLSIGIFRIVYEPPIRLSLIIGDYVHNLRSTLDHLVWQLSLLTTATPNKRSQFPIFDKADTGAEGRIRNDWTRDVPLPAQDLIVSLQPYNRPGYKARHFRSYPLWQIGVLDGIDKHATPLVTVLSETLVTDIPGGSRITTFFDKPLQDGDPVFPDLGFRARASSAFGPSDKQHVYIEPAYGVIVEETPRLVLPLADLRQLHEHIDRRILPRFSRFFPSRDRRA